MTLGIRPGLLSRWWAVAEWLLIAHSQNLYFRPEIKQDYPPNLSILISGGKENNCDALSNGE